MDENEAMDFLRISHRLGHLIYYEHDPLLQDVVVLKPDWLSTAISFVLDDRQTRDGHGLVEYARLVSCGAIRPGRKIPLPFQFASTLPAVDGTLRPLLQGRHSF